MKVRAALVARVGALVLLPVLIGGGGLWSRGAAQFGEDPPDLLVERLLTDPAEPQPEEVVELIAVVANKGRGRVLQPFVPGRRELAPRGQGPQLLQLLRGPCLRRCTARERVASPNQVAAGAREPDRDAVLGDTRHLGVLRADDRAAWMMVVGEKRPGVVVIPPPLWHGAATVGPAPAGLLYFVTRAYDPNDPDEERTAPDALGAFPWQVQHR